MFGYIKPDIPELKVKDYELYKASYCGLCRAMGKCTGCASRFTLSYDFAFLALVRMAIEKTKGEIEMERCMVHPLKKRPMLKINSVLEYASKSSVILTRQKLKDNINDTKGLSRLKAKIAGCVSLFLKKTEKSLLPLEEKIQSCIDKLSELEKEQCDSVDMAADTFGELLAVVSSYGLEGGDYTIAYEIGYHLGKWIYVIDACDDFAGDLKSGSYNVLRLAFGEKLEQNHKKLIQGAMFLELGKMSKAVELIDFSSHRDVEAVIKNIIYDGLVAETKRVLKINSESDEQGRNEENIEEKEEKTAQMAE